MSIQLLQNLRAQRRVGQAAPTHHFTPNIVTGVRSFHHSFEEYQPTRLLSLDSFADRVGVEQIIVKDESDRMGLEAFKVLGGSYAITRALYRKFAIENDRLDFLFLKERLETEAEKPTIICATDGNHGRGVAWTAQQLGCRAMVYMPEGSVEARVEAIRTHGAEVTVVDGNYDSAVELAEREAYEKNWLLVQDTSGKGYSETPLWILQGYLTIMDEIFEEWEGDTPTHIFVQCGVGSFPASVFGYFEERFGSARPKFVLVEPDKAACCYLSMMMGGTEPRSLPGHPDTIMAGLNCNTPSHLAWPILRDHCDFFVTCPDEVTKRGMRLLASPAGDDPFIESGESGAVTAGLVDVLLTEERHRSTAESLGLSTNSRVLLFSTEGATDPEAYDRIVNRGQA